MARWKIESKSHFRVSDTERECCSFHPPLVVGTEVYIGNVYISGGRVEKWSLELNRSV